MKLIGHCPWNMRHLLCIITDIAGGDYRDGNIRLVEGRYNWEGRVEIYLNGQWGSVNFDSGGNVPAFIACRQLDSDMTLDVR